MVSLWSSHPVKGLPCHGLVPFERVSRWVLESNVLGAQRSEQASAYRACLRGSHGRPNCDAVSSAFGRCGPTEVEAQREIAVFATAESQSAIDGLRGLARWPRAADNEQRMLGLDLPAIAEKRMGEV